MAISKAFIEQIRKIVGHSFADAPLVDELFSEFPPNKVTKLDIDEQKILFKFLAKIIERGYIFANDLKKIEEYESEILDKLFADNEGRFTAKITSSLDDNPTEVFTNIFNQVIPAEFRKHTSSSDVEKLSEADTKQKHDSVPIYSNNENMLPDKSLVKYLENIVKRAHSEEEILDKLNILLKNETIYSNKKLVQKLINVHNDSSLSAIVITPIHENNFKNKYNIILVGYYSLQANSSSDKYLHAKYEIADDLLKIGNFIKSNKVIKKDLKLLMSELTGIQKKFAKTPMTDSSFSKIENEYSKIINIIKHLNDSPKISVQEITSILSSNKYTIYSMLNLKVSLYNNLKYVEYEIQSIEYIKYSLKPTDPNYSDKLQFANRNLYELQATRESILSAIKNIKTPSNHQDHSKPDKLSLQLNDLKIRIQRLPLINKEALSKDYININTFHKKDLLSVQLLLTHLNYTIKLIDELGEDIENHQKLVIQIKRVIENNKDLLGKDEYEFINQYFTLVSNGDLSSNRDKLLNNIRQALSNAQIQLYKEIKEKIKSHSEKLKNIHELVNSAEIDLTNKYKLQEIVISEISYIDDMILFLHNKIDYLYRLEKSNNNHMFLREHIANLVQLLNNFSITKAQITKLLPGNDFNKLKNHLEKLNKLDIEVNKFYDFDKWIEEFTYDEEYILQAIDNIDLVTDKKINYILRLLPKNIDGSDNKSYVELLKNIETIRKKIKSLTKTSIFSIFNKVDVEENVSKLRAEYIQSLKKIVKYIFATSDLDNKKDKVISYSDIHIPKVTIVEDLRIYLSLIETIDDSLGKLKDKSLPKQEILISKILKRTATLINEINLYTSNSISDEHYNELYDIIIELEKNGFKVDLDDQYKLSTKYSSLDNLEIVEKLNNFINKKNIIKNQVKLLIDAEGVSADMQDNIRANIQANIHSAIIERYRFTHSLRAEIKNLEQNLSQYQKKNTYLGVSFSIVPSMYKNRIALLHDIINDVQKDANNMVKQLDNINETADISSKVKLSNFIGKSKINYDKYQRKLLISGRIHSAANLIESNSNNEDFNIITLNDFVDRFSNTVKNDKFDDTLLGESAYWLILLENIKDDIKKSNPEMYTIISKIIKHKFFLDPTAENLNELKSSRIFIDIVHQKIDKFKNISTNRNEINSMLKKVRRKLKEKNIPSNAEITLLNIKDKLKNVFNLPTYSQQKEKIDNLGRLLDTTIERYFGVYTKANNSLHLKKDNLYRIKRVQSIAREKAKHLTTKKDSKFYKNLFIRISTATNISDPDLQEKHISYIEGLYAKYNSPKEITGESEKEKYINDNYIKYGAEHGFSNLKDSPIIKFKEIVQNYEENTGFNTTEYEKSLESIIDYIADKVKDNKDTIDELHIQADSLAKGSIVINNNQFSAQITIANKNISELSRIEATIRSLEDILEDNSNTINSISDLDNIIGGILTKKNVSKEGISQQDGSSIEDLFREKLSIADTIANFLAKDEPYYKNEKQEFEYIQKLFDDDKDKEKLKESLKKLVFKIKNKEIASLIQFKENNQDKLKLANSEALVKKINRLIASFGHNFAKDEISRIKEILSNPQNKDVPNTKVMINELFILSNKVIHKASEVEKNTAFINKRDNRLTKMLDNVLTNTSVKELPKELPKKAINESTEETSIIGDSDEKVSHEKLSAKNSNNLYDLLVTGMKKHNNFNDGIKFINTFNEFIEREVKLNEENSKLVLNATKLIINKLNSVKDSGNSYTSEIEKHLSSDSVKNILRQINTEKTLDDLTEESSTVYKGVKL